MKSLRYAAAAIVLAGSVCEAAEDDDTPASAFAGPAGGQPHDPAKQPPANPTAMAGPVYRSGTANGQFQ